MDNNASSWTNTGDGELAASGTCFLAGQSTTCSRGACAVLQRPSGRAACPPSCAVARPREAAGPNGSSALLVARILSSSTVQISIRLDIDRSPILYTLARRGQLSRAATATGRIGRSNREIWSVCSKSAMHFVEVPACGDRDAWHDRLIEELYIESLRGA